MNIVWNEDKTMGIVLNFPDNDDNNDLAKQLRKGTTNTLGLVEYDFMETWGDMTDGDNRITEYLPMSYHQMQDRINELESELNELAGKEIA